MIKYFFSFLVVLLVAQCEKDTLPATVVQEASFGKAFVLEQEAQQTISGTDASPLTLQLGKLSDSRCPEDVVCVWMGNATVTLMASDESGKSEQLDFCIGDCRPDPTRSKQTIRVSFGEQAYDVTLLEVLPYPNTKTNATANQVKLLVEPVS
ncbi:MAG: hypothetical protein LPK03_08985 [Pontibacter sp.]|nr:hypothetical protein [Pontibacter sp.]